MLQARRLRTLRKSLLCKEIPDVFVPLPPVEDFTVPVHSPVHQEQIVAGEITQNIDGNFAVQDTGDRSNIPPVVERIQEQIVDTIDVTLQGSQFAPNTSSTSTSHCDTPARAPRRPPTTVLMHSRACSTHFANSSLLWRI